MKFTLSGVSTGGTTVGPSLRPSLPMWWLSSIPYQTTCTEYRSTRKTMWVAWNRRISGPLPDSCQSKQLDKYCWDWIYYWTAVHSLVCWSQWRAAKWIARAYVYHISNTDQSHAACCSDVILICCCHPVGSVYIISCFLQILFGPLFDGAVVDQANLPFLVRATSVNAFRALRSLPISYRGRLACNPVLWRVD